MTRPKILTLAMLLTTWSGKTLAVCNPDIIRTKPDAIYTNNSNGTVTDIETNLMWMQCSIGQSGYDCSTGSAAGMNWKRALESVQAANDTNTLGYSDWRLPNINELASLAEKSCHNPAINVTHFPATPSSRVWSASPLANGSGSAWAVNFSDGSVHIDNKYDSDFHDYTGFVRLVRDDQ